MILCVRTGENEMTIRVYKKSPKDPSWGYIHDAADLFIKKLTDGVALILRNLQNEIDLSDIEEAIKRNDPAYIINNINWADQFDDKLLNQYEPAISSIMAITGTEAWNRLELPLSFTIRNPYSERWMAEHGAQLVVQVTEETKAAIRRVVLDGFELGKPPRELAKRIREMVGLTERDAKAVLNYWAKLSEEADLTAARVDTMADTYAKRLLRKRALNIARNETMEASNEGTRDSWLTARDNEFILPESVRVWIAATQSDRTCPICMDFDGREASLDEPFISPTYGERMNAHAHISCRCAQGLRSKRIA